TPTSSRYASSSSSATTSRSSALRPHATGCGRWPPTSPRGIRRGRAERRQRCRPPTWWSEAPQDGHDPPEHLGVVPVDGGVGVVGGEQPHVAVLALEGLDRRLVLDERSDDLPVLRHRLAPHDDPVAVADGGVDHRVARDPQEEELAVTDELAGEGEDVLDGLLGEDRPTGRDPPDDGDEGGRRGVAGVLRAAELLGALHLAADDLDGPGPLGVAAQVALALQRHELVLDRRGAGQPDDAADLPHSR